jgi:hypothetical protein
MRASMTPDDFNRWLAFRQLCPDKMERLIHVCKIGFTLLANAWGAKIDPCDLDPQREDEREHDATPQQAAAIVAMALGKPDGNRNR